MSMVDTHSSRKRVVAIGAAALDADNTPAALDVRGFRSVNIDLDIGDGGIAFTGNNKVEFTLTHSDDNVSYSPVTDADMIGVSGIADGIIKSLVAAHAAATVHRYGYRGGKNYLKLLANFGGTHSSPTPMAASVELSHPLSGPVADQA